MLLCWYKLDVLYWVFRLQEVTHSGIYQSIVRRRGRKNFKLPKHGTYIFRSDSFISLSNLTRETDGTNLDALIDHFEKNVMLDIVASKYWDYNITYHKKCTFIRYRMLYLPKLWSVDN